MTGFHSASEYSKTSLVMLGCLCVFISLSYGTPYWTTTPNGNAGLWRGCTWGLCYERWDYWTAGWIKATQAFMTIALIFITFASVSLGAYIFHRYFDEDKRLVAISMVLTFGTSVFLMLAVFAWAANEHYGSGEVLNWSFALAAADCLAAFVCGTFLFMELGRPVK